MLIARIYENTHLRGIAKLEPVSNELEIIKCKNIVIQKLSHMEKLRSRGFHIFLRSNIKIFINR